MENTIEVKYCRREVSVVQPDNTWISKPCGDRISQKNPLNWCAGCRKRLPLWPAGDLDPAPLVAAIHREIDTDCGTYFDNYVDGRGF